MSQRIIVLGPSGAGKSYTSRKLRDILDLPLYYLDKIWWKSDKTHISREEFDKKLEEIVNKNKWIIDGDYSRTYKIRMERSDLIIFLDFPLEECLKGVESRLNKEREEIPWVEEEFDPEFKEWIIGWFDKTRPTLLSLLDEYKSSKKVIIFKNRTEVDEYLKKLE